MAAFKPLPEPAAVLSMPLLVTLLSPTTCMPILVKDIAPGSTVTLTLLLLATAITLGEVPADGVQLTVELEAGAVLSQVAQALLAVNPIKPNAMNRERRG